MSDPLSSSSIGVAPCSVPRVLASRLAVPLPLAGCGLGAGPELPEAQLCAEAAAKACSTTTLSVLNPASAIAGRTGMYAGPAGNSLNR